MRELFVVLFSKNDSFWQSIVLQTRSFRFVPFYRHEGLGLLDAQRSKILTQSVLSHGQSAERMQLSARPPESGSVLLAAR